MYLERFPFDEQTLEVQLRSGCPVEEVRVKQHPLRRNTYEQFTMAEWDVLPEIDSEEVLSGVCRFSVSVCFFVTLSFTPSITFFCVYFVFRKLFMPFAALSFPSCLALCSCVCSASFPRQVRRLTCQAPLFLFSSS